MSTYHGERREPNFVTIQLLNDKRKELNRYKQAFKAIKKKIQTMRKETIFWQNETEEILKIMKEVENAR